MTVEDLKTFEEARKRWQRESESKRQDESGNPLETWTLEDMLRLEPPAWAVEGLIPAGGRVLLYAPSGHHKTNLAVDAACHVAHGRDFHDHAVASHPVVIVATEDPRGTAMRVVGWHDHHAMPDGRVVVVPGGEFRLNDPTMVARLKATGAKHFPGERVGYVIDHYDVSMDGDPTATNEAVEAAAGLRVLGDGAAFVLLLAHAPWATDQRAKMPVALWANLDARLRCERDEATGRATLTVQHQKNGCSGLVLRFEFEVHTFATRKGNADCLIARRLTDAPDVAPEPAGPKLGDNEKLALDCLGATLVDLARDLPPSHDIPRGVRGVRYEEWLAAAVRYIPPEREEWRWRADFKRAVKSLLRKHLVRHVAGWCWLPKHEPRTTSHVSHDLA
jgi:hypothetical protein